MPLSMYLAFVIFFIRNLKSTLHQKTSYHLNKLTLPTCPHNHRTQTSTKTMQHTPLPTSSTEKILNPKNKTQPKARHTDHAATEDLPYTSYAYIPVRDSERLHSLDSRKSIVTHTHPFHKFQRILKIATARSGSRGNVGPGTYFVALECRRRFP